jgi:hypothetical protein
MRPFKRTHEIVLFIEGTSTIMHRIAVMLEDGAAYTKEEWEHDSSADWECDCKGEWTFQGKLDYPGYDVAVSAVEE